MRGRPPRSLDILAPGENSITTINHTRADTFTSLTIDKKKQLSEILKDPKIPKKSSNIKIDRNLKNKRIGILLLIIINGSHYFFLVFKMKNEDLDYIDMSKFYNKKSNLTPTSLSSTKVSLTEPNPAESFSVKTLYARKFLKMPQPIIRKRNFFFKTSSFLRSMEIKSTVKNFSGLNEIKPEIKEKFRGNEVIGLANSLLLANNKLGKSKSQFLLGTSTKEFYTFAKFANPNLIEKAMATEKLEEYKEIQKNFGIITFVEGSPNRNSNDIKIGSIKNSKTMEMNERSKGRLKWNLFSRSLKTETSDPSLMENKSYFRKNSQFSVELSSIMKSNSKIMKRDHSIKKLHFINSMHSSTPITGKFRKWKDEEEKKEAALLPLLKI